MWPPSLPVILQLDSQSPMQTCDSYLHYRDILSHLLKGMPCTQCEVLDVGKYLDPSFGLFSQVFGFVPGFF